MLQTLLSSTVRAKLLTHLFSHPGERFYARALAEAIDEHYSAVWRELDRLRDVGLLLTEREGNIKYYRLNKSFPIYEELRRIIIKTSGIGDALRAALAEIGSLRWTFVYGSVASGQADASSDLDLMLIGQLNLLAVSSVVRRLEEQLGREINYTALTEDELAIRLRDDDPFIATVMASPQIVLIGDEDELRRVAGTAADQAA